MLRKEAVAAVLGSPVAYYNIFAKALGCVEAGILTSQMFYWYGKGHDPEGWIYKTQDDIFHETGLTRRNQEMARRKMRQAKVLEETKRGVPAKLYYRLNMERLFEVVQEYLDNEAAAAQGVGPDDDGGDDEALFAPDAPEDAPADDDAPSPQSHASPEVEGPNAEVTSKDVQTVHPRMSKPYILGCANRTSLDVQTVQTGMREMDILASANRTDKDVHFGHANTKTTTKITTETTQETTNTTTTTMDHRIDQDGGGNGGGGGADGDDGRSLAARPFSFLEEIEDRDAPPRNGIQLNLAMRSAAAELMTVLAAGAWRNRARYLADLTSPQLTALTEWLWLWRLTEKTNPYEMESVQSTYGQPFVGLENVPGYIIAQVRDGQRPELDDYDLEQLAAFIAAWDDAPASTPA